MLFLSTIIKKPNSKLLYSYLAILLNY